MKLYATVIPLFSIVFFTVCKEPILFIGEFYTTIVDDDKHFVLVTETASNITFFVEVLQVDVDNRNAAFPNTDLIYFGIDQNNNGEMDTGVDIGLSVIPSTENELCSYYFLENGQLSPCGEYESNASIESFFESTDRLQRDHLIWKINLPKSELNQSGLVKHQLHYVLKLYNQQAYYTYPENTENAYFSTILFEDTMVYYWE